MEGRRKGEGGRREGEEGRIKGLREAERGEGGGGWEKE